jgi:predicted Zn-dependent protease
MNALASRFSNPRLQRLLAAAVGVTLLLPVALPSALAKPKKIAKVEAVTGPKVDPKAEAIAKHHRMAEIFLEAKSNDLAAEQAREVLKLDKKHLEARRILIAALGRMGKHDEALAMVDALDKDMPGDGWVALVRYELYNAKGDKAMAATAILALAERPDAPIAAVYQAARLLDDQRRAGNTSQNDKQRSLVARFMQAREAWGSPEWKDAERMVFELDHGETGREFWEAREAYYKAFQTGGAMSVAYIRRAQQGMQKIVKERPELQAAWAVLGMCHASVKSPDYDLKKAEALLRKAPAVAEAWFFLGRLLREQERLPESAAAFEKAVSLQRNHVEAGYQLGVVYKAMRKTAEAVRVFEAVVQGAPDSAAATRALAELQALAPNSPVVGRYSGRVDSPGDGDLFGTERYKAGIDAVEKHLLGGVEENADVAWLEKMMRRLIDANDLPERVPFRVKIGKTMMINCFATPHGNIYVTKGFLEHLKKAYPEVPMDENNSYMAGVMAHEVAHVIKNHVVSREAFKKTLEQSGGQMDPTLFRLTTRMNEIEADREGFLYMLAAGYNPNAMVEWMEQAAKDLGDPPPMEDHPTFDERVTFLLDYWTNEIRFAWQAFEYGTSELEKAQAAEGKDLPAARKHYETAIAELDRYVRFFRGSKEAWNNLAVAQTKLGVLEKAAESPLSKWYTPLSIERSVAQKLPKIERKARRGESDVVFLERAKTSLNRALELDPKYKYALVNLAAVHVGLRDFAAAKLAIGKAKAAGADAAMVATLTGVVAAEEGRWDEAIASFEAAGQSGKNPRALYCVALAKQGKGDKAGAKEAFLAFLSLEDKRSPWAAVAQSTVNAIP